MNFVNHGCQNVTVSEYKLYKDENENQNGFVIITVW